MLLSHSERAERGTIFGRSGGREKHLTRIAEGPLLSAMGL